LFDEIEDLRLRVGFYRGVLTLGHMAYASTSSAL
jgi:hypothetical protein